MTPSALVPGMGATLERTVGEDDSALALGSGTLPVLGTPRLLAWCEAATCAAIAPALKDGQTSVGTRVALEHVAPSALGAVLEITASSVHVDGRLVRFSVAARQQGRLVGSAEVTRVVVDSERFLSRVPSVPPAPPGRAQPGGASSMA